MFIKWYRTEVIGVSDTDRLSRCCASYPAPCAGSGSLHSSRSCAQPGGLCCCVGQRSRSHLVRNHLPVLCWSGAVQRKLKLAFYKNINLFFSWNKLRKDKIINPTFPILGSPMRALNSASFCAWAFRCAHMWSTCFLQ